jgi:hypothetical protein
MKSFLRAISPVALISLVINGLATLLQSEFLIRFLDANLITLLVALLAINTTTMSVIMTKMREITQNNKASFESSVKEMRLSIIEQVGLIGAAIIVQSLKASTGFMSLGTWMPFVISSLVVTIFFYALYILWDTANGIFVILRHE